jgi:hypothetical protein
MSHPHATPPADDRQRWYPGMPPALPDETDEQYTDRLTGADRTGRVPYDHHRNRQCSIGWHNECTGGGCECPCHGWVRDSDIHAAQWNAANPIGTRVTFLASAGEPPTTTTSKAYVGPMNYPVVALAGFPDPVQLAWITPDGTR